MTSIHDLAAVEALVRSHKIDVGRLRKLRNAFFKRHLGADKALAHLGDAAAARAVADAIEFHPLALDSRHDSALDGATKLIFRSAVGLLLESVILRLGSGRTALCVSTQVGCAANCQFCATGKMGIARDLSAAEILDQLAQANQLLAGEGRSVRNVVFMGMGEPFHNEAELHAAIDVLVDSRAFHLNPKRLLISTVGIPEAMIRSARRYPDVRVALSLHSARQKVRRKLMPIAERYPLDALRRAMDEVTAVQGHPVMIEYLLLASINDTDADVEALGDFLRGLDVHVNLIPYNPIDAATELVGTGAERRTEFSAALKAAGFKVTTRYSLGADIAAACGQLVRRENRRLTSAV